MQLDANLCEFLQTSTIHCQALRLASVLSFFYQLDLLIDSALIKIEPLFAIDSTQVRAILRYQDEHMPYESFCAEERLLFTGLNFWQHWLPCSWHVSPSVYLAKEDGIVLGLISETDRQGQKLLAGRPSRHSSQPARPRHSARASAFCLCPFRQPGCRSFRRRNIRPEPCSPVFTGQLRLPPLRPHYPLSSSGRPQAQR